MANEKTFVIEELVGHDWQGNPVRRTVEVPDGKWILEASTHHHGSVEWDPDGEPAYEESEATGYSVVGGADPVRYITDRSGGSGDRYGCSTSWGSREFRLVADRPFGVVVTTEENGEPLPYLSFRTARQVHKGELGRSPEFPRPRFAREANPCLVEGHVSHVTDKPVHRRDIRRGRIGWARLVEVAALVGMPHERLVDEFFPFADARGHGLPVLFAATREEIHGKIIPWDAAKRFHERDLPQLFDHNPATIWVRQGFAKTVLCLHHLGYRPNAASKAA